MASAKLPTSAINRSRHCSTNSSKRTTLPWWTNWPGLAVGSHNDEVLRDILQLDDSQIDQLRDEGVIA